MQEQTPDTPPWDRAIIAAGVAFAVSGFWPGFEWSPFFVAAAAYFALPPRHRTRTNAMTIGWSVGFVVVFLLAFVRAVASGTA